MNLKLKTLLFGLALFISSTILKAQSADDIISKYIQKVGGTEKWNLVKSMISAGNSQLMGQEFPYTVSSKSPNLNRLDVTAMGQTLIQAYDGKTAWTINPFQGSGKPEIMSPELTKAFSSQNQIRPSLFDLSAKGLKSTIIGKENVGAVACDKIEITHPEGDKDYYFFDPSTSLLVLIRKTATGGQLTGKTADSYLSDYRDEQGLLIPHIIEIKVDGQVFSKNITNSVKINTPVDSKLFDFPKDK
jgi:hypothetical protein